MHTQLKTGQKKQGTTVCTNLCIKVLVVGPLANWLCTPVHHFKCLHLDREPGQQQHLRAYSGRSQNHSLLSLQPGDIICRGWSTLGDTVSCQLSKEDSVGKDA
jgi:hypothetical protein